MAGHEGCNELGHHIVVDVLSDLLQTSELVEAAGCNLAYMLLECQLLVDEHSEITHYTRWLDDFVPYLQCQVGMDVAIFCSVCRVPSQMISDLEEFRCRRRDWHH